jgi:hypothetical protein
LEGIEPALGICKIIQGRIAEGIHTLEESILRQEKGGYRRAADHIRLHLAEMYLQIIAGNEKLPFSIVLKNLVVILKVMITGSSQIRSLVAHNLENPHFDPLGHQVGRAQMILGLLYKAKKKRALALQHLTEAKRIFSQFGQTPILARVDAALAELGQ